MTESMSRKNFVRSAAASAATLATVTYVRFPGDAAEFTIKFGHDLAADHPTNIAGKAAGDAIAAATKGRVEVQMFPSSQLGNDTTMLSNLRSGGMQMMAIGDNILATLVPAAAIDNLGFAWANAGEAFKALDGDLGSYVRDQITAAGLQPMEKVWAEGFREITTSTKPIKTPDDLNGFKMRVPPSPISTSLFSALGASPTTINIAELYSALQTHIVDGQENPLSNIEQQKFYEVQKYCTVSNHMYVGYWLLLNMDFWNGLPKDVQGAVAKGFNDAASSQRSNNEKLDGSLEGKLKGLGLQFFEVDRAPFKAKLVKAGFYNDWKGKFGDKAWSLLEKYTGKLG